MAQHTAQLDEGKEEENELTREARVGHACRGKGLQRLLGATKRAYPLFDIILKSDYRR